MKEFIERLKHIALKHPTSTPALLVFPFNLLSHYTRCIKLVKPLKEHYAIYFAHSNKYHHLVEEAGFESFSCEEINPEEVMQSARKFEFSWINEKNLEKTFLSQRDAIVDLAPAAVLGDVAFTLKMASTITNTPYFSIHNGYMTKYYARVRNLSHIHPAYTYRNLLPEKTWDFIIKTAESFAFTQVHLPFNKLRKKYNLPTLKSYLDEFEGDHNFICDLPEIFPQKRLPFNYSYISPLYFEGTATEDKILKHIDNDKKSILVCMGSSGDLSKLSFLEDEYFSKYNIVSVGSFAMLNSKHILNIPYLVNNTAFLDKIDLMICHGGNGTIYQALAFGVPLLCAPSFFEQEWNVQGLQAIGLTENLNTIKDKEKIKQLIDVWIKKKQLGYATEFRYKIKNLNQAFEYCNV
jgi:UDP:flavonoid glycosyltransferase YjiC (YdhE family)